MSQSIRKVLINILELTGGMEISNILFTINPPISLESFFSRVHIPVLFSKRYIVLLIAIVLFYHQGVAQISKISTDQPTGIYSIKADYYFDYQKFTEAVYYYSQSLKENPGNVHSMLRMSMIYGISGEVELADSWYQKALNAGSGIEAGNILKYVFDFIDNKMYDKAWKWLDIYEERIRSESNDEMFKDTTLFLITKIESLNSENSEIAPAWYRGKLIFNYYRVKSHPNPNEAGHNLYEAVVSSDDQFKNIRLLHEEINSKAPDGQIAIAKDQGTLFFSGIDPVNNAGIRQIYSCEIPDGPNDRIKISQLSFKDFTRSIIHPAVNAEGDLMYFAVENEIGESGYDIYKSEGKGNRWQQPMLLGQNINTQGDELYPYLHNDSILYFASNGHDGFGGLDIFRVNVWKENAAVENLGPAVNTSSDDFGVCFKENSREGFFSSNRPGGKGGDDIYGLFLINTKVNEMGIDVPSANSVGVTIHTSGGSEVKLKGSANENIEFSVSPGLNYTLYIDKDNYNDVSATTGINENYIPDEHVFESMKLKFGNEYNFLIKKFVRTTFNWNGFGLSTVLRSLQANPGDLITFQFVPDSDKQAEANRIRYETKISFKNKEVAINTGDTLVLGYTVEEAPVTNVADKNEMVADAETNGDEHFPMEGELPDTILLADNGPIENVSIDDTTSHEEVTELESLELEKEFLPREDYPEETRLSLASPDQQEISENEVAVLPTDEKVEAIDSNDDSNYATKEEPELADDGSRDNQPTEMLAADIQIISSDEENEIESSTNSSDEMILGSDSVIQQEISQDPRAVLTHDDNLEHELKQDSSVESELANTNSNDNEPYELIATRLPVLSSKEETVESMNLTDNQISNLSLNEDDLERNLVEHDIQYRVQIAASRVELNNDELKKIYTGDRVVKQFTKDNYFKYYIAEVPELAEAKKIRNECGVDDAFIVKIEYRKTDENSDSHSINSSESLSDTTESNIVDDQPTLSQLYNHQKVSNSEINIPDESLTSSLDGAVQPSNAAVWLENRMMVDEEPTQMNSDNDPGNNYAIDPEEIKGTNELHQTDSIHLGPRVFSSEEKEVLKESVQEESNDNTQIEAGISSHNSQLDKKFEKVSFMAEKDILNRTSAEQEIQYRVQIAASRAKLEDEELKLIYSGNREISQFQEGEYVKYYIAEVANYFTAKKILRESEVKNGFVVAYNGDEKIELEKAIYAQYKEAMEKSGLEVTGNILEISTVNFEFDEFILLPDERSKLRDSVINKLKADKNLYAIVNGHTDVRGSDTYNFGLSEERALFVRELIIGEGIQPQRVETHYFGESQLAKYCDEHENCDESVHQVNRRVEVILLNR